MMVAKTKKAAWVIVLSATAGALAFAELGDPPPAPDPKTVSQLPVAGPLVAGAGYSVTITNREEVRTFFNTVYMASENAAMGWTGDAATCNAGTTATTFRDEVARRINYFRAMAGVPATITFDTTNNAKDQQAALMMSVNHALSHSPPSSWSCWTANGSNAANNSNLSLGSAGPGAISSYIEDAGANNTVAGHRRWIVYPQTQTMGTGDVPVNSTNNSANALWVFDGHYGGPRPATRDTFVSWPPPGFVPYKVVWPRWSFSYPSANFSSATVSMSTNGVNIPVTLQPVATGYGENTLVWYPSSLNPNSSFKWPKPAADTPYNVTIQNVVISGSPQNFNYTVTVFDPSVSGADAVLPVVSGTDNPIVGVSNLYTFVAVPFATGHQWQHSARSPFTYTEGAETGLTYFTTNVSPGYSIVINSPVASGAAAFHLAHPTPPQDQILTYTRVLLPGTNSQLQFKSKLGSATAGQVATVQASLDQGSSWNDLYSQPGSGGSGESTYLSRSATLTNYTGRSILVRFRYAFTGGSYFPQTTTGVGWCLDDISFTNTEELTNPVLTDVVAGNSFAFLPPQSTNYALQVRAQVFDSFYSEWGPVKLVTAVTTPSPSMQIIAATLLPGNQFQIDFAVTDYVPGMTFHLLKTSDLSAGWSLDPAAVLTTNVPNSRYRFTTPTGGVSHQLYRVRTP